MINPLFHWRVAMAVVLGALAAAVPAQAQSAAQAAVPEAHIAVSPVPPKPQDSVPAQGLAPTRAVPAVSQTSASRPGRGAHAPGTSGASGCAQPVFSQPFAQFGDFGSYTLMPGESVDAFTATGWKLSGGAHVVTTTLNDGATGSVLDMPSGASAISPPMCVAANYPTARTMIRDISGSAGLQFLVAYKGTKTWNRSRHTGLVHGNSRSWTLSQPFKLQPARTPGWQVVRFAIFAIGHRSDYQLYNAYVDPHFLK